jgi:hypothetical protein
MHFLNLKAKTLHLRSRPRPRRQGDAFKFSKTVKPEENYKHLNAWRDTRRQLSYKCVRMVIYNVLFDRARHTVNPVVTDNKSRRAGAAAAALRGHSVSIFFFCLSWLTVRPQFQKGCVATGGGSLHNPFPVLKKLRCHKRLFKQSVCGFGA